MSKDIDSHILDHYETKKLMGSGAYGHVWKVIDRKTHKQYALKKIFDAFRNSTDAQRTYREINILWNLDNPNIIKLYKVIKSKNNKDLYLVFEYMEADLHSLIGQNILEKGHINFVAYQLLRAVNYIHSGQILHRDLKPSNILINEACQIKICDFGLSRTLTHEENEDIILSEEVATRWYRSPEMLLSSKDYSKPTDVWSIGCIIAEILLGKPIFPGNSTLHQLQRIVQFTGVPSMQSIDSLQSDVAESLLNQLKVNRKFNKQSFKNCDQNLLKIVCKMLEFNPKKRITIQQAMSSQIFSQFKNRQDSCDEHICTKFIVPWVDDNVKLSLQQYRKIIYRDIERRYPEQNSLYKNIRSNNSFKSTKKTSFQEPKKRQVSCSPAIKRQRSMAELNKKNQSVSSKFLKNIDNLNNYKNTIIREYAKVVKEKSVGKKENQPLKRVKSKKMLKKKIDKSTLKFKN